MLELKALTDYSDESVLAEIRRAASQLKGKKLTPKEFDSISRVHSSTLVRRFGSWASALDKAGIRTDIAPRPKQRVTREMLFESIQAYVREFGEPPKLDDIAARLDVHKSTLSGKFGKWPDLLNEVGLQPVPLGRRYTDQECYENILALWTHYGRQPHFRELQCAPSRVGSKAYVLRWGGWRAALGAFIDYINQSSPVSENEASETVQPLQPSESPSNLSRTSEPRSLSLALRYRVLIRDRSTYQICGRSPAKDIEVELHIDHIIPWSKEGKIQREISAPYAVIVISVKGQNMKMLVSKPRDFLLFTRAINNGLRTDDPLKLKVSQLWHLKT